MRVTVTMVMVMPMIVIVGLQNRVSVRTASLAMPLVRRVSMAHL
jgi:hypothetical protein